MPMTRSVMARNLAGPALSRPESITTASMAPASVLNARPDPALRGVEDSGGHQQEQYDLEAHTVPLLEVRLRSPHQKTRDIMRHLRDRRRRLVGERDLIRVQRRRHRDL